MRTIKRFFASVSAGVDGVVDKLENHEAVAAAVVGEVRAQAARLKVQLGQIDAHVERLRNQHPEVKTVLLSFRADPPLIQSAVALGADGYLLKNARKDEILAAIREVMRGGCYFSPPIAREIVDQIREPGRKGGEPFTQLSAREREVLRLIAEGLSAKEIATDLNISTKTVEAHRTSLMRKLGVRKATELVRYAVRHGLIEA